MRGHGANRVAERRKRSIQEHEAAAKQRGDNAVVNVNGNVNDWFMIANLYDEAAENLEETLRDAMKNAGKMKIAEESSALRQSFRDKSIPSYAELMQKPDIDIVDIRGKTVGSLKEQRQEFMQSDIAKRLTSAPIINKDTGEAVFITSKTFTHSFSNTGLEQIAALKNLQQIVENAVLTHRENSRSEKYDSSTGVFTLFAAVRTDTGVIPVKLKVKEYLTSGGGLPSNVMDYVSANNASEYAKLYDSRVLVLDDIEKEDASSSAGPNLATGTKFGNYPLASSKISIADLYDLVNESYKKYLPAKTGDTSARYSLSDDTDETDLPGWDEDNHSKFDQFTDTYEKGTNLIGKSQSIQAAAELKREYVSRANTQSIAAKYRQMSTIAEQFSNVHLDGIMGEELLGKENRTRIYEEVQQQLMELGRKVAERRLEQSILSPEVLEWAKHSTELDRIVARMRDIQKKEKLRVSQVRSNTYVFTLSVYYKKLYMRNISVTNAVCAVTNTCHASPCLASYRYL